MEQQYILIGVIAFLLIVNLGTNIALLLKQNKQKENYATIINKNPSPSKPSVNVANISTNDSLSFSIKPSSAVNLSTYEAYIDLRGVNTDNYRIVLANNFQQIQNKISSKSGKHPNFETGIANIFTLNTTFSDNKMSIKVIRNKDNVTLLNYEVPVSHSEELSVSVNSNQPTQWSLS